MHYRKVSKLALSGFFHEFKEIIKIEKHKQSLLFAHVKIYVFFGRLDNGLGDESLTHCF